MSVSIYFKDCADGDGFVVNGVEYRIAEVDSPESDQVSYNHELVFAKDCVLQSSSTKLLCRQVGVSHNRLVVQVWTTSSNMGNPLVFHSVARALVEKGVARYAPFRGQSVDDYRRTQQNKVQMVKAEKEAEKNGKGMFAHPNPPTLQEIEAFRAAKRERAATLSAPHVVAAASD